MFPTKFDVPPPTPSLRLWLTGKCNREECAGGAENKFANSAFIFILRSQDLKPAGAVDYLWPELSISKRSVLSQWHKLQRKIVNNGTKQYVIFNYQYFLFVIFYENRQYYYPAWSWLIVAQFTICCWPSRPTFPFSLRIRSAWRKCWAFRPTTILWSKLQWAKIKLSDIAYRIKNDNKNTANISTTFSFVPLFTIFLLEFISLT